MCSVPAAHVQVASFLSALTSNKQCGVLENHNKSKVFVSQKDRVPKYFWASKQSRQRTFHAASLSRLIRIVEFSEDLRRDSNGMQYKFGLFTVFFFCDDTIYSFREMRALPYGLTVLVVVFVVFFSFWPEAKTDVSMWHAALF